jgi:hypothetical protein
MSLLGLYNSSSGCLEGADDPGRVFVRRVNSRALAGALSLIQLHLQGCDSTVEGDGNIFILLFTLFVGVGVMWIFNWFARVAESSHVDHVPVLEEPTTNEVDNDDDGTIKMSHIGAAIVAANSEFPSSNAASSSTSMPSGSAGTDPIEMPVLRDENDLPEPDAAWSPEAMLTFIYTRSLRRRSTATTLERQQLYEERLQLLCNVMNACKSGDQSVRLSAAVMARNMTDLSSDEESPNYGQSWIQLCNTMDEVDHAVEVGQSLANAVAIERATTSDSSHVDSIARALMENIDNPPMDEAGESEDEDSDEMMETESQRAFRYGNSELCEVSDPEAWMVMHHGNVKTLESEQMEGDAET